MNEGIRKAISDYLDSKPYGGWDEEDKWAAKKIEYDISKRKVEANEQINPS